MDLPTFGAAEEGAFHMTYLQMKCFLSLATTQKMSETASALGLSLSTLSKYIGRMEDELSVPLFEKRLSRKILTREGELTYPGIKYIVKQYDDLRAEVFRQTSSYDSSIKIAVGSQQSHVIRQLSKFIDANPKVKVEIIEGSASDVCAMLDSGTVDVGIVYEQIINKKYPLSIPLGNDQLCAVVPDKHPLSVHDTVSIKQLMGEKFFLYKVDTLMYNYLLNVCIAAGFVPDVEHSTLRMSTLLLSVAAGNGVSLFSKKTVEMQDIPGNKILYLAENPLLTISAVSVAEYPSELLNSLIKFFPEK